MLGIPLLLTFFFVNLGAWRRGGGAEVEVADRPGTVRDHEVVQDVLQDVAGDGPVVEQGRELRV
jgi:hypothetical protein